MNMKFAAIALCAGLFMVCNGDPIEDNENASNNLYDASFKLPQKLQPFLLKNEGEYLPIAYAFGDANLDGINDALLALANAREKQGACDEYDVWKPTKRPLLLLLGQKDGSYKLAARNDDVMHHCLYGGAFGSGGDVFSRIVINKGYFTIEHAKGSINGGWEQYTTFKYDKTSKNWLLHKDRTIGENYDITKTKKDFVIADFNGFYFADDDNER